MNKKGITLIELVIVLVLISLMTLLIYPVVSTVIRDSKNDISEIHKRSIREAAEIYVSENISESYIQEQFESYKQIEISLDTLVNEGYLDGDTKDSITGKNYDLNASKVIVKLENNSYSYKVELNTN